MIKRSLHARLALSSSLIVSGSCFLVGLFWYHQRSSEIDRSARAFAAHEAQEIALFAARFESAEALQACGDELDFIFPEPGVIDLEIWDASGRLVFCADPATPTSHWSEVARAVGPEGLAVGLLNDQLVYGASCTIERGPEVWIGVAFVEVEDERERLYETSIRYALGLVVVTLIVLLGSRFLLHEAFRPLSRLLEEAALISREGPGHRLSETDSAYELGELVTFINTMLEAVEASIERQKRFTSHASHELRTPLTRMRGIIEVALLEEDVGEASETLSSILEEVVELQTMLEALLQLARSPESWGTRREEVAVAPLLDDLAHEASVLASERDITIMVSCPSELRASTSQALLSRALWNLTSNAIRHSPAGGVVRLEAAAVGERLVIAVSDEGEGVPEALRPVIFEPFQRGPGGGALGLGLSLVRQIVEQLGGTARLDDSASGGRFVLELPLD